MNGNVLMGRLVWISTGAMTFHSARSRSATVSVRRTSVHNNSKQNLLIIVLYIHYRTVSMDFYGRNDIPFGSFLERYCFREAYQCPSESCDMPMVDHVRRFVHETGCLQIVLKKLDVPIPGYQNNILMWGWCRKCKQVSGR